MFYFFEIRCLFRNWSIGLRKKPIRLSVSAQYSVKSTLHLQNVSYWFNSLNYASWPHSLRELGVRTTAQEVKTHLLHGTDKVGVALLSLSPFFPSHFVTRRAARYSLVLSNRVLCSSLLGESIVAAFYAGWWFNHLNWSCWWGLWFWDWRPEVQ